MITQIGILVQVGAMFLAWIILQLLVQIIGGFICLIAGLMRLLSWMENT
jgi:hypothetical protein